MIDMSRIELEFVFFTFFKFCTFCMFTCTFVRNFNENDNNNFRAEELTVVVMNM